MPFEKKPYAGAPEAPAKTPVKPGPRLGKAIGAGGGPTKKKRKSNFTLPKGGPKRGKE